MSQVIRHHTLSLWRFVLRCVHKIVKFSTLLNLDCFQTQTCTKKQIFLWTENTFKITYYLISVLLVELVINMCLFTHTKLQLQVNELFDRISSYALKKVFYAVKFKLVFSQQNFNCVSFYLVSSDYAKKKEFPKCIVL